MVDELPEDPDSRKEWREAALLQYQRAEAWQRRAGDYIEVVKAVVVLLESPDPPHDMAVKTLKSLIDNHVTIPWRPLADD